MFITYFYLTQYIPFPELGYLLTPLLLRVGIAIINYVVRILVSNHLILGFYLVGLEA